MSNQRFCIGLDVGKDALHLCKAGAGQPDTWQVQKIEMSEPDWYLQLLDFIPPNSFLAIEPTGWHYSRPIVAALELREVVPIIYQVNHQITANIRKAHISRAKNDTQDARALAYITKLLQQGEPVRGVQHYNHFNHMAGQVIRLHLNSYRRLTKQTTRNTNILRQLGHSIWPALGRQHNAWLRFIEYGAITPDEINAFVDERAAFEVPDGRTLRPMLRLASELPPDIMAPQPIVAAVRTLAAEQRTLQQERERIEQLISVLVLQGPYGEVTHRWRSVPFLNDMQIAALHVATAGQAELMTKAEFTAAVGAAPDTGISGSIDKTRAGHGGYRPARDAIFLTTLTMQKPSNWKNQSGRPIILEYFQQGHSAAACRRKLAGILSGIARAEDGHWPQKKG